MAVKQGGRQSYLFTRKAETNLREFCAPETLFAFDYDGTLAAIVTRPEQVRLRPRTRALLSRLEREVPVAAVSGRSVKSLREVLPTHPRFLIGNHGFESPGFSPAERQEARRLCSSWVRQLARLLAGLRGVHVENKRYSLSVHYREVKGMSLSAADREVQKRCRKLSPEPRLITGKCVLNLLPQAGPDKGSALLALMRLKGFSRALYVGDDDTDEDVFKLPEARSRGGTIFGIRVGLKRSSRARYFIREQREIDEVLEALLRFVRESRAR